MSSSIRSIFCFHVCRLMLMQAPCQKPRLTREKRSSPREHCGNTDAGGVCQVIAEQPPMVSRLPFGDAVAIKSKPSRRIVNLELSRLLLAHGFCEQRPVEQASRASLNQTPRIEKFGFTQPRPDKLQASDGNGLVIHWNRYGQRRISSEIHRSGVLQS
jgi:hypothetical protein